MHITSRPACNSVTGPTHEHAEHGRDEEQRAHDQQAGMREQQFGMLEKASGANSIQCLHCAGQDGASGITKLHNERSHLHITPGTMALMASMHTRAAAPRPRERTGHDALQLRARADVTADRGTREAAGGRVAVEHAADEVGKAHGHDFAVHADLVVVLARHGFGDLHGEGWRRERV